MRKKIIRYTLYSLLSIVALFLIFLEIMILLDYRPAPETVLARNDHAPVLKQDTITIFSWNIGYAGLSADMDFFYEGGYKMRPSKEQCKINLKRICDVLQQNDSADILLIQEIDLKARRSYSINQLTHVAEALPYHSLFFAKDYDVAFVPVPLNNPTGQVQSGIAYLTRPTLSICTQHAYPSQAKLPMRPFMIDNCFTIARYPLDKGNELVVINTHNSAYDDGAKRTIEMDYLRKLMIGEYKKGNYVIAGGDWNQAPPIPNLPKAYSEPDNAPQQHKYFIPLLISSDFMPAGWQWISDGKASNRFLYEVYQKGHTAETLIDFFLISPNVQCLQKQTIDLGFSHTDHNPIVGKFVLNRL